MLQVAWASVPPYIYLNNSGEPVGGLLDMLEGVVDACCPDTHPLTLGKPHHSLRAVEETFGDERFVLPVVRNPILMILDQIVPDHHFYPIMQAPGKNS